MIQTTDTFIKLDIFLWKYGKFNAFLIVWLIFSLLKIINSYKDVFFLLPSEVTTYERFEVKLLSSKEDSTCQILVSLFSYSNLVTIPSEKSISISNSKSRFSIFYSLKISS